MAAEPDRQIDEEDSRRQRDGYRALSIAAANFLFPLATVYMAASTLSRVLMHRFAAYAPDKCPAAI